MSSLAKNQIADVLFPSNRWILKGERKAVAMSSKQEIAEYFEDEYNPLLNIIKNKIANNKFPLIVFEGNSDEKLTTINSSSYLTDAYNRLGEIEGTLFTFGSSLNKHSDKHIIDKIKVSKFKNIYLGYHEN